MVTSKKPNNIKGCNIGNIGNIGNIKKDLWRFFYTHKKTPFYYGRSLAQSSSRNGLSSSTTNGGKYRSKMGVKCSILYPL